MQKTTAVHVMIAVATALAAPAAVAQVAKVNGVTIPQARADALLRDVTAQGRQDTPELRKMIKERLIDSEIMTQEAVRLGINKNPEVSGQLELARQQVLVNAFVNEMARRNPATEDAMKKAHERFKDSPAANEFRSRHILVASEAEANAIIKQIKDGADFAKLASEKSRDEGTKAKGGELDWAVPATYVRPFAEALARLKKGGMTEAPVQTNFGWHVIRLEDIRPVPYETLKQQLQQVVQQENVQKAVADLRAKAKVE